MSTEEAQPLLRPHPTARAELRLEPLYNPTAVDHLFNDPFIADRMRHDEREPGFIEHDAVTYQGAWEGGSLVGVFLEVHDGLSEVEVHIAFRRHAILLARAFALEWLATTWRDEHLLRITALPYATSHSAINFTRKLGFRFEGLKRQTCRRGGIPTDVAMMGMTRSDWVAHVLMIAGRQTTRH